MTSSTSWRGLTVLLAAASCGWAAGTWIDVSESSGIRVFQGIQGSATKDLIIESIGGGCAFIDYDGDGRLDILLVRGSTAAALQNGGDPVVALFRNLGNARFADVSAQAGLMARGWGMGVTVADYDNDGRPDIFVTGLTRNFLFHNTGDAKFEEVAISTGVARRGVWSTGAAFGDIDGDGWLDLYVASYVDVDLKAVPKPGSGPNCIYKGAKVFCGPRGMMAAKGALFRNLKGKVFEDVTKSTRIAELAPAFYSLQPLIADFDGDGRQDIFVANDSTPNYLFRNLGDWRFDEVGIAAGVAVNMDGRAQACMGAALGDTDNDGRLDLVVTNFSEDTNTLYRNLGNGMFEDASWSSKIGPPSWLFLGWGVQFLDFDNDGWNDIIVANGHVYPQADQFGGGSTYKQRLLLHRNAGRGVFSEIGSDDPTIRLVGTARGLATGDIDGDGRVDVLVNQQDGSPRLLLNRNKGGHWLKLLLKGVQSNRDGVGVLVTLKLAGYKKAAMRLAGDSYLSSSSPELHFGLGQSTQVEQISIAWPSGRSQILNNVPADRTVQITEPETVVP